jgi:signal transduction histidine kinase
VPGLSDSAGVVALTLALGIACLLVARLYRRTRSERAQRLDAERVSHWTNHLQQLTGALSRATTAAAVVEVSVPEFLHALSAAAGFVARVSDDGRQAAVSCAVGYAPAPPPDAGLAIDRDSAIGRALWNREIRTIAPDDADGAARVNSAWLPEATGTSVAVPLIGGGRVVALLYVSFSGVRSVSADEREFLFTAGRRTAEALVRADHYEAAERARADAEHLRRRADDELRERQKAEEALRESETKYRALAARTSHLYALSAALSESLTLDAVARAIVRQSRFVAGASAGSVALLVDHGTAFETLHAEEYPPPVAAAWRRFPAASGSCWNEAVATTRPVYVSSFHEWRTRFPASASIGADCGFASLAALPLMVEDAPIGVLMFHFVAPVSFDDEYRAVLVSVAHHSAQAIDRARLYESAQHARVEAERANRAKDDFLSTVSHELRTPLTAVLGWGTMLRKGTLDAARTTRAIEAICNNAARQAQLIDELLDVSRLVGGRTDFDLREVDLRDSLRGAVEAIMPLAEAKGLEVRLGSHPTVPVTADPRRLEQIFLNLLSNAVKFTPPGGRVTLDAVLAGPRVQVRVTDNGSGIEPGFLPHVFDRFRQGESDPSRSAGGLGLGLFIARQLVEAQGGTIQADSAGAGAGATFTVSLPVTAGGQPARTVPADARPAATRDAAGVPGILTGVRVLIVDDEPDVRELMTVALERSGATVTSVESAGEGLMVLGAAEVDVLLADLAMPGQDGYALIQQVRALGSDRALVPAAAVTACAREDERQRALAAGFQLHLTKPLQPDQLVAAVSTLAHRARC